MQWLNKNIMFAKKNPDKYYENGVTDSSFPSTANSSNQDIILDNNDGFNNKNEANKNWPDNRNWSNDPNPNSFNNVNNNQAQMGIQNQEKPKVTFAGNLKKNFNFNRYAKMESNLSYLKIIAILLVTMTHTMRDLYQTNYSLIDMQQIGGNVSPWLFMILQVLSIICVNLFVCISCYLENKSFKVKFFKVIKLYLLITFILCVTQALEWIIAAIVGGGAFPLANASSWKDWLKCFIWFYYEDPWYFTAYFAFLLLVPFINLLYSKLSLNGKNVAFGVVMFIFISWKVLYLAFSNQQGFTGGASTTANNPLLFLNLGAITDSILGRGYNFLNFFVIYAIIQWLVAHDFFYRFRYGWWPLYICTFGLMYLLSVFVKGGNINAFMYSNPLVILMSVCVFGGFLNIKCKKRKTVNYLSTLTLYVFALHWNALGKVFIQTIFRDPLNQIFRGGGSFLGWWYSPQDLWVLNEIFYWALFSFIMFLIAIAVDMIFKFCTAIPAWQKMVAFFKETLKLDKFENIALAEKTA
ncbi:MAG: hypothetical protein HUJ42_00470 [Malacoplasma sp.]|nr:hypothetical protein [Malacoplasma sp.]